MEDQLVQAREHFIQGMSRISQFWGFSRAMGAIYGAIYLSQDVLSLDELVEQVGVHELQAGAEQFRPDQQGEQPTDHQHREREQQVHRADVLVVRREQPAAPAVRVMFVVRMVGRVNTVLVENCAHGDVSFLGGSLTCGRQ